MTANLFLHHFAARRLTSMLGLIAQQTRVFAAAEPARSRTALAAASLLRLLGCNDVTMHDAKISVRAGFRDRELTGLWPRNREWRTKEWRAGLFTHAFVAAHDPSL